MRSCKLSLPALLFAMPLWAQAPSESLRIGPGDLLSVHVFREPDLDSKVRVKDAGTVALPLVGQVEVAGLNAADAAAFIGMRYREGCFLNQPQVSVFVEESHTEQVQVLGEVQRPGAVSLTSPRSLLDVLAGAGGLTKAADRHVTIRRREGAPVTALIPRDANGQLDADVVRVFPGDTVLVPRAGIVYVLGDVARPGGFLMQDDSRMSLLQALAMAAGATRTASENNARLLRTVNGIRTEQPLHLQDIERGKAPDPALENDDIVYVPFSFGKNLALGASSIAASASSAIIYAAY